MPEAGRERQIAAQQAKKRRIDSDKSLVCRLGRRLGQGKCEAGKMLSF